MEKLREIFQEIWKSWCGKISLILFLIFIFTTIFVEFSFPKDFGKAVWNNPNYWADYPQAVPPSWTEIFGKDQFDHRIFEKNNPGPITEFKVEERSKTLPTFLSFLISEVIFEKEGPIVEIYLVDKNREIFLYRHIVSTPKEKKPPFSRYKEVPFRIQLSAQPEIEEKINNFFQSLWQKDETSFLVKILIKFFSERDRIGKIKFVLGGRTYGLMGTDNLGRDIFKGLLAGLPIALFIGLIVALLGTCIGAVLGGISGYSGGKTDIIIQRITDIVVSIPLLPILIFLIFILGPSIYNIILILVAFGWTGMVIKLRSWVLQLRELGFVTMCRAKGLSPFRIIFHHILFWALPFLFVSFVYSVPGVILAEAGLSFLGLGDPSLPTWGQMLEAGFKTGAVYLGYWWQIIPPGLCIMITGLSFILLYLSIEQKIEPRIRRQ